MTDAKIPEITTIDQLSKGIGNPGAINGSFEIIDCRPEDPSSAQKAPPVKSGILAIRHQQAILLFCCFFTTFFLRVNLSVAIVAMTNKNSSNPDFEEFDWSEKEKSAILSAFYCGYLVAQMPAGMLGQVYSPKTLLIISNSISALLSGLTPVAAMYGGWMTVGAIRIGQGIVQGFLMPMTYNLASKWSPLSERNRFVGFTLNGGTIGATVCLPICGLLASSAGGWPSIFYFSSAVGFLWVIFWYYFGGDSPSTHPRISAKEKNYIIQGIPHMSDSKNLKTPWKDILTSVPVWALIGAHVGSGWGFGVLMTQLPSYITLFLGFDITLNGFLSALPYLALFVLTFPVCYLADYVKKRNLLSPTVARKLWTTIGTGLLLLVLAFVGKNSIPAIVLLTITVSLTAFIFSGFNINHLDLTPNHVGVLIGLGNGMENITAIVGPLSVGWIVSDPTSVSEWRLLYIITACFYFVGNAIFVLFGTAEVQPWNTPKK